MSPNTHPTIHLPSRMPGGKVLPSHHILSVVMMILITMVTLVACTPGDSATPTPHPNPGAGSFWR